MPAEGLREQLLDLVVAVDEVFRLDRVRVDERVDVGDLGYVGSIPVGMSFRYQTVCLPHTELPGERDDVALVGGQALGLVGEIKTASGTACGQQYPPVS